VSLESIVDFKRCEVDVLRFLLNVFEDIFDVIDFIWRTALFGWEMFGWSC
jgi:hypothetical protein